MQTERQFIEAQDAEINSAKAQWMEAAEALDKAEKAGAVIDEQVRRLNKWQRSAREFFRIINDAVVDSDGLRGSAFEHWKNDRVASAINVLSGLLKHQENIRHHRSRLNQPDSKYEFAPAVFENLQSVVAWERPEEAKRLRRAFKQADLPTGGFDRPRELKPSSEPVQISDDPDPLRDNNTLQSNPMTIGKRGLLDIVHLSLLCFGVLGALCVIAGLFFKAGPLALFFFIALLTTGVSLGCIIGGGFAIYRGLTADTKFKMFGVELSSQSVGVAFMGIGLVIGFFTLRGVLGKVDNIPGSPLDSAKTILTAPPANLKMETRFSADAQSPGDWAEVLKDQLSRETLKSGRLIQINTERFEASYREFSLRLKPRAETRLHGGYAFLLTSSHAFVPLAFNITEQTIIVPTSHQGDSILIFLALVPGGANPIPDGLTANELIQISL